MFMALQQCLGIVPWLVRAITQNRDDDTNKTPRRHFESEELSRIARA
jgi:hypothetical protein